MSIQISESKLSPEARKALQNAKSKSQFMRDAIEFYVKNRDASSDSELLNDIREIKNMLSKLCDESPPVKAQVISHKDKKEPELIREPEIKKEAVTVVPDIKRKEPDIPNVSSEKINTEKSKAELDEEKKREIEKLLDKSLEIL